MTVVFNADVKGSMYGRSCSVVFVLNSEITLKNILKLGDKTLNCGDTHNSFLIYGPFQGSVQHLHKPKVALFRAPKVTLLRAPISGLDQSEVSLF